MNFKRLGRAAVLGTAMAVGTTAIYAMAAPPVTAGPVVVSSPNPPGTPPILKYTPADKTVYKGGTVTFVNRGDRGHSATSGTGPTDAHLGEEFDTGIVSHLDGAEHVVGPFDEVGVYPYFCKVQPRVGFFPHFIGGMKGNIHVIYNFEGFQAPIGTGLNTVKAGSTVPIKFGLDGDQGSNILTAPGSSTPTPPASQETNCDSGASIGSPEDVTTPGSTGLSYDATTGTYSYLWKTKKEWAGQCRQLRVKLRDGETHTAAFRFH